MLWRTRARRDANILRSRARNCRARVKRHRMPEIHDSVRPEAVVTIRNRKGLHARASAKFVKCAESFDATITGPSGTRSPASSDRVG
ncbi:MAG: HPr family phosphocarrier protein [Alphaproteobacteria bacterium]